MKNGTGLASPNTHRKENNMDRAIIASRIGMVTILSSMLVLFGSLLAL